MIPAVVPEPLFTVAQQRDYQQGWERFARGQFWHAHESWERLWQGQPDPARRFLQGLIQLTAAYFLVLGEAAGLDPKPLTRPLGQRFRGALRNFEKAQGRLQGFPATYLHVDVIALRQAIASACQKLGDLGPDRLTQFPPALIPPQPLLPPF